MPAKRTTTEEYRNNLITIIELIRDFEGVPILVTPLSKREFGKDGKVLPYQEERSEIVIEVAKEFNCDYVDLNSLTKNLYNELGEEASRHLTLFDNLHLLHPGAEIVSGLVIKNMPTILKAYVESFQWQN